MSHFQSAIQSELQQSDALVVLARGLGMATVFTQHVAETVTATQLIVGMNMSRCTATQLIYPTLHAALPKSKRNLLPLLLPRFISADYSIADRRAVYAAGGFVIATSAVLVHDLLHDNIPAQSISSVLIFAADTIREQSNDHFALKLLRMRNSHAAINAFSENAPALTRGFHNVEKLMRILYLSRLSLWPRFHTAVKSALSRHVPDLIDLCVPLTPRLKTLQTALFDTATAILDDVRHASHALDTAQLYTSSNALVPNFDYMVSSQIENPTPRVRSLLSDLTVLRKLLYNIFDMNAIHFYQHLLTLRHTSAPNTWLVRKEAQRAVLAARSRVWQLCADPTNPNLPARTIPTLQPSPKWHVLQQVLSEISADVRTAGPSADVSRVLIVVREQRIAEEITAVLTHGCTTYMQNLFQHTFPSVAARARDSAPGAQITLTQLLVEPAKRRTQTPNPDVVDVSHARRARRPRTAHTSQAASTQAAREELQRSFELLQPPHDSVEIMVWAREWVDVQGRGHRVLDEFRPAFVVLYDADVSVVRETEVYKALHPGRPVRMYILTYDDAAEEERFRGAIGREKKAFKTLIRERATMTVHADQDGRKDDAFIAEALTKKSMGLWSANSSHRLGDDRDSRVVATRKDAVGGGKVIVDTRELRSSLPMLLYQSNLVIVPITLEVADFVVSKNIGIERKSVPDLYGSFGSGRLFNQAEALCRHYRHPCLLIELGAKKALSLTATSGGVPPELLATSIVSKMVLLVQQFPALRLLWAKGASDAAELFATLKVNEAEPDVDTAAALGVDSREGGDAEFNAGPRALLRNLPGIDSSNLQRVMRKVRNVSTLISMTKEEMTEVLGNSGKATLLYNFVNEQPSEALAAL